MDENNKPSGNSTNSQPKNTLSDFIENNHRVISVLGVFTALTVFSYNLALKPFGYALSFVFLTLTVIIWLELWSKFPKRPSSWRLTTFENILTHSTLGIIAYWLLAYREIWRLILYFPVWLIVISIITYPVTKFGLLEKLLGWRLAKYSLVRYVFGLVILIIVIYIAAVISTHVTPPVNNLLDQLRYEIDKFVPSTPTKK